MAKFASIALLLASLTLNLFFLVSAQNMSFGADNFYRSQNVSIQRVNFQNQFGMNLVGNLFTLDNLNTSNGRRHAAIIVGHPQGAVKEQSANLYAQKLAERGFVTLSLDQSFFGESDGFPRGAVSPDIYAEAFSAAVDFLGTRPPFVDRGRIGVLGICASGGYAISAAKIDPRLKAIATVSMYDMGENARTGMNHSQNLEQRRQNIRRAAAQRYADAIGDQSFGSNIQINANGTMAMGAGQSAIMAEFYDFYNTRRGQYPPSGSNVNGTLPPRSMAAGIKFMNFYPFNDIETISPRPLLFIAGQLAHSREFSEEANRRAAPPKELYIVPQAGHVDLYDRTELIPFDKLDTFFSDNL